MTPLAEDGDVDAKAMRRLAETQLEVGVDGRVVGGDGAARHPAAGSRRPGGRRGRRRRDPRAGTHRVVATARAVLAAGADAVVVAAPFCIAPDDAEIVEHYRVVAAAVDAPLVAYDYPAGTGARLSPAVVEAIAGNIVALKDSSGDLTTFHETRRRVPDLPVLTGSELLADTSLQLGAAGLVPGLGNVDLDGHVRLYRAAREGRWADAAAEQDRLARLFRIVDVGDRSRIGFTAGALGVFKAAMVLRGVIPDGRVNPPMLPLAADEIACIAAILSLAGL